MPGTLEDLLVPHVRGTVTLPGDARWDTARAAYNLAVDQRPRAVVRAACAEDVQAVMRAARELGLRVAPQGTGHGCGPMASLEDAVLVRTDDLGGVEVDPAARRVRAGAGVRWAEVAAALDPHGLAALAGTSATVRVAGYTLGGGIGFLGRAHGLACNAVLAVELVTADGALRRVDAGTDPDLFWALRGGGGSFGVVTAIEFAAVPAPELYAGALFWDASRAPEVFAAWREWIAGAPPELTSTARILMFPPIPDIPEPFRGRAFANVQGAFLGSEADGAALWAPMRELDPEIDTLAPMAPSGLAAINMDPPDPLPYAGDGGLLTGMPDDAVTALLAVHGPGTGSPLISVEVRHLGGALAEARDGAGALAAVPAPFAWFAVGAIPVPEAAGVVHGTIAAVGEALSPWDAGRSYLNFAETPCHGDRLFGVDVHARLRAVRSAYDPDGILLANHQVAPA
ncbi:MAG: FAD-binding oxidoreductase [Thermoleophilia bacterium]